MADAKNNYPTTVDSAVRLLQELVPENERVKIRLMTEDDLTMLDFGLGQWVRNHFGLWGDNPALLQATGEQHADDASGFIIRAFWLKLRDELPKVH
ncbi:hypothetical protein LP414_09330 [Polaromonas sp. P1(28)-13]|nr:hypothetical protein LP414_09330 [Polaromonas sp. P1(28)-13]